jgi:hypothetical protein
VATFPPRVASTLGHLAALEYGRNHAHSRYLVSWSPDSQFAVYWTLVVVVLCIWTLFRFPTRVAFGTEDYENGEFWLDSIPDCLFLVRKQEHSSSNILEKKKKKIFFCFSPEEHPNR